MPTLEDKLVQRAVLMLLEPICEHDFMDCSHGFRPGRSAHQALEALWKQGMDNQVRWVLDVNIKSFFDTLDHAKLRAIISQRVKDGVISRLTGKWLKAGVMEAGEVSMSDEGTPQGGVISPLLSNIFLHEVLDKWFANTVQPRLKGRAMLVRYADDFASRRPPALTPAGQPVGWLSRCARLSWASPGKTMRSECPPSCRSASGNPDLKNRMP